MILIVTSKDDLTADYLIIRLMEKCIPYFRLNTEDIPLKLEGAAHFPNLSFRIKNEINKCVYSEQISGVWYRRPKMLTLCKNIDAQIFNYVQEDCWFFINGLLELTNDSSVWISRPENIRRAENKIYQLKAAYKCGLKIPRTFIGNSPEELKKLTDKAHLENIDLIAKPIRTGRYFFQDGTKIFHTSLFPHEWESDEIKIWPVIVQEKICKKRDIRTTIICDKSFSVGINTSGLSDQIQLDWRRAIDEVIYEQISLPSEITNKLFEMLHIMGLSFGAFDLIETCNGEYVFLEINPNGQWAWIEEKTGLPMREALIQSLTRRI